VSAPFASDDVIRKLLAEIRRYGHARFPPLRHEIEDLANETIADFVEYLAGARQAGGEKGAARPAEALDPLEMRRIAFAIFRRRAVDALRQAARRWTRSIDELGESEIPNAPDEDHAKRILLRQMLRICMAELASMSKEDRNLLAMAGGIVSTESAAALSPRDRQRLHRLRERLAQAIRKELGASAKTLLKEDL
jgi:RNA polymerase sigma-70 factor (ECF subfamily)